MSSEPWVTLGVSSYRTRVEAEVPRCRQSHGTCILAARAAVQAGSRRLLELVQVRALCSAFLCGLSR